MPENEANDPWREFVKELTELQPALRAFVRYLLGGASQASDVFQDVNMLLWEKREQFTLGTNFRAWAFKSARFVVLGKQRQLRKEGLMLFDSDLVESLAAEWEAQPDEHEHKLAALEICLVKLPDADLGLLRARYSRHGEIQHFANETKRTGAGLRTRIFRLRAALKQCVMRELNIERGLS